VLFFDPLTAAKHDSGWEDSELDFESDGLHLKGDYGTVSLNAAFPDSDISVTQAWLGGDSPASVGITIDGLQVNGGNSRYVCWITEGGGWGIDGPDPSALTPAPQQNAAIISGIGSVNQLEVRVSAGTLTFLVNGQELGSKDWTSNPGITPGLFVFNGGYGGDNEVIFTNFTVKSI
jgi:hypothetical protein